MTGLDRYIEEFSSAEGSLLTELDRMTNLRAVQPQMVSGAVQSAFLRLVVEMVKPRRVLEIGTFTGYSALSMASGMAPDARLHTIEVNDELEDMAREFFARSEDGHKIELHIGSALDIAPRLGEVFDLVFIDGDKREYPDYWRMVIEGGLVRSGSIILADNVLWYGKVADGASTDRHTEGIREFNSLVIADPRVENVIIPLRDGINLIRVL